MRRARFGRYDLYIFDADGTLRWTKVPGQQCPYHPDEWALMPNVRSTLRKLCLRDHAAIGVASNQDHVSRGHLSKVLARSMVEDAIVAAVGRMPARCAIELCTGLPKCGCPCRKPSPHMLLTIMGRLGASRSETLYVGDLDLDRRAARHARVSFAWAADFFGWH